MKINKAIPLQAWTGPEGSRMLRLWLPVPPRKYSWYSFLLEVELTPGRYYSQKD